MGPSCDSKVVLCYPVPVVGRWFIVQLLIKENDPHQSSLDRCDTNRGSMGSIPKW